MGADEVRRFCEDLGLEVPEHAEMVPETVGDVVAGPWDDVTPSGTAVRVSIVRRRVAG
jgi:hypothetical protein